MNHQTIFSSWFSVLGFTLLLGCSTAFSQTRSWNPGEPVAENLAEHGEFIAAFDWSVERSREFVWPFESMRPAPYESVWMVVERMPRVLDEKSKDKKSEPLLASRCLKINGRFQKPLRLIRAPAGTRQAGQQEFLVKLDQGRLRLSLMIPRGRSFDPAHQVARIKLYHVDRVMPKKPSFGGLGEV